jgi:hypothetical protein
LSDSDTTGKCGTKPTDPEGVEATIIAATLIFSRKFSLTPDSGE